jgi:hypothetical protein
MNWVIYAYDKTIGYFRAKNKTEIVEILERDKQININDFNKQLKKSRRDEIKRENKSALISGLFTVLNAYTSKLNSSPSGSRSTPVYPPAQSPSSLPQNYGQTAKTSESQNISNENAGKETNVKTAKLKSTIMRTAKISLSLYRRYNDALLVSTEGEILGKVTVKLNFSDLAGNKTSRFNWTVLNETDCLMTLDFVLWYGDSDNNKPYPNMGFVPSYDFKPHVSKDYGLDVSITEKELEKGLTFTVGGSLSDCE